MWDEDLDNLDEWIRRLRVEFDIFFNGHRKKPPDDLKMRVERLTKKLAEVNMNFSERFRYNTLVGRFYVYRDHWRRQLQEREQGLDLKSTLRGAAAPPETRSGKNGTGEEIQVTIVDPAVEEGKVRQLYEWLRSARNKREQTTPEINYRQFARYISSQTAGIKQKLGCSSVVFRVALEEDAIKFTARGTES